MDGHLKIVRYGSFVDVVQYSRPFVHNHTIKRKNFTQREQSQTTQKTLQSLARAKSQLRRKSMAVTYVRGTPAFVTFTFRPPKQAKEMERPTTVDDALKAWNLFAARMLYQAPDVAMVRVLERHKNGVVHFHALMWGLPADLPCFTRRRGKYVIHTCPLDKNCERKRRESMSDFSVRRVWGNGHVDVQLARNSEKSVLYMVKYIAKSKDADAQMFKRKFYEGNKAFAAAVRDAKEKGVLYERSSYGMGWIPASELVGSMWQQGASVMYKTEWLSHWLGQAHYERLRLEEWPDEQRQRLMKEHLSASQTPGNTGEQVPDPAINPTHQQVDEK